MTIRNVYLDCEFLPADPTLRGLVSIGLTDDDGIDYYAVNGDFDMKAFKKIPFMMDNVWPSLPKPHGDIRLHGKWPRLDLTDRAVKTTPQIAQDIADYFAATDAEITHLWACGGRPGTRRCRYSRRGCTTRWRTPSTTGPCATSYSRRSEAPRDRASPGGPADQRARAVPRVGADARSAPVRTTACGPHSHRERPVLGADRPCHGPLDRRCG
jgi:hypothetical protein